MKLPIMVKYIFIFPFFLLIFFSYGAVCDIDIQYDPSVDSLISKINQDSIYQYISRLQSFNTRYAFSNNRFAVAESIKNWYMSFGISNVWIDTFLIDHYDPWGNNKQCNVIAEIPGTEDTIDYLVVGGHYDSCSDDDSTSLILAPGANDNASGVAATMEIARVLATSRRRKSVLCIAFAAEEIGLLGSEHCAYSAKTAREKIVGMYNYDIIGNNALHDTCQISRLTDFPWTLNYSQVSYLTLTVYLDSLHGIYQHISWDDGNFIINKFPAVCYAQYWYNNRIHTVHDSLIYLDVGFASRITKAGLAALATIDKYPPIILYTESIDNQDGTSLTVTWSASGDPRLAGYRVCYGLRSGVYTDSLQVTDSTAVIGGLMADSTYHIAVYGYYADGTTSISAHEVIGIPRLNPVKPVGLAAEPLWHGLRLSWHQNPDPDLAGYRLYRRMNQEPDYDSLNTAYITDTTYIDSSLNAPNKYYYRIRAFDTGDNFSVFSDSAYGRPATLDRGILVVDETQNWTSGQWPRDTAQDRFYDSLLVGFPHEQYDFGSAILRPVLSDLVPYSTVVWHGDDLGQMMAANDTMELRRYLDFGGKIWFVGWKPLGNLRAALAYPDSFNYGQFIYDYFGVSAVDISGNTDSLQEVIGTLGYPNMPVDGSKYPPSSWGGVMRNIESYFPAPGAEAIYYMDMRNNASPFEGAVCGVRYLGPTYNTALFGFPLYFMDMAQARLAAQKVMADFGETGVGGGPSAPLGGRQFSLGPCVPNPFNRSTTIRYQLPQAGSVSLKVYNVAGQQVRTLVEGVASAGAYAAAWDGRSDTGRPLAAGVYLARLSTPGSSQTIRIALVR